MIYEIKFKKSAIKDLLNLPAEEVQRIVTKIDQLAIEPRPNGCKKIIRSEYGFMENQGWKLQSSLFY